MFICNSFIKLFIVWYNFILDIVNMKEVFLENIYIFLFRIFRVFKEQWDYRRESEVFYCFIVVFFDNVNFKDVVYVELVFLFFGFEFKEVNMGVYKYVIVELFIQYQ